MCPPQKDLKAVGLSQGSAGLRLPTSQADGRYAHFELVYCKCVDTYVRVKQNQNQVCWKWVKVR